MNQHLFVENIFGFQFWNTFSWNISSLTPFIFKTFHNFFVEKKKSIACFTKQKQMCYQFDLFFFSPVSSVTQFCPNACDSLHCSKPGFPVHSQCLELAQTHVLWVGDAIQPSHPLSSSFPLALILSQHQCHFQWLSFSHQMAKVLVFLLQHQSFQWIFRTDILVTCIYMTLVTCI